MSAISTLEKTKRSQYQNILKTIDSAADDGKSEVNIPCYNKEHPLFDEVIKNLNEEGYDVEIVRTNHPGIMPRVTISWDNAAEERKGKYTSN